MTLDEFLRTLDALIDEHELADYDDPGEGNFSCEDCRKCNHCRFCVGCDSCEDCTYCEESIDCTGCTQSKRCISCEKVSYCEDCRDCTASRYLTLCVECKDCVHCLACVGLEGAEFYVLNQKRTRKEYFALLHQVQELMQARMQAGWRPAPIGLASDVDERDLVGDPKLSAAPWLDELAAQLGLARAPAPAAGSQVHDPGRDRPGGWGREPDPRPPTSPTTRPAGYGEPSDDLDALLRRPPAHAGARELYAGAESGYAADDEPWADEPRAGRAAAGWMSPREPGPGPSLTGPRRPARPPTGLPAGTGGAGLREPAAPTSFAEDRERDSPWLEDAPWLEDDLDPDRGGARNSLRRAGRPRRPDDAPEPRRDATGSGSYRTGSAPGRSPSDTSQSSSSTGAGLRLGRKPDKGR